MCETSIGCRRNSEKDLQKVAKLLFIRCENSSQNLGCSKTSTSNTRLTVRNFPLEQYNKSGDPLEP